VLNWKLLVTTSKRSVFRLAPSTPRTGESGSGLWATPTEQDSSNTAGPSQFKRHTLPLNTAVHLWPMPGNTAWHSSGNQGKIKQPEPENYKAMTAGNFGQLNADWVSILMGFPADWTVVDGSAAFPASSKGKRIVLTAFEPSATH